jgi:EAL and modified HD-GYP domain-containing signal transduction protein
MFYMPTVTALKKTPEAASLEAPGEMRSITRQPILDENHRVHGYELRFPTDARTDSAVGQGQAPRTILDDTVIFGIDRFTSGLPGFVNCSAEELSEQLVSVLPPAMTVLEIPEQFGESPALLEECRKLRKAGFRLALLDFNWSQSSHPLLDLVEYVKLDLSTLDQAGCRHLRKKLHSTPTVMMASNVETQPDHRRACAEGFTLFQGYYFCHPELMQNAKVPANRLFHMDILRQLQKDSLDLHKISPLVMRDAALTYRLLRLVNSPVYAIRQEVRSVESAIMVVGETTFRRIAMLAILSEFNAEQPPEILHMAMIRARFCELAAGLCNLDPDEQYLLGMFSLLPAMMRHPMETLAPELPLRDEIRQALLGTDNRERCLLSWIESYEKSDQAAWNSVAEAYNLRQQSLVQYYIDAVVWDATANSSAA